MALLVRITDADGSDPIVLENASNIMLSEKFKDRDSISFTLPQTDPKLNKIGGLENLYTKLWEVWDGDKNIRLNHGPIHNISETDAADLQITGPGKTQFLEDIISSRRTYFYPVERLLDDLRFENLTINPSTMAFPLNYGTVIAGPGITVTNALAPTSYPIASGNFYVSSMQDGLDIFESTKFHGLSKKTAVNAIDDLDPSYDFGANKPKNTWYTTNYHWAGNNSSDTFIVDLGKNYTIAKVSLLFPWWGGPARLHNRTYDWALFYADDPSGPNTPDFSSEAQLIDYFDKYAIKTNWYSWFRPKFPNKFVTSPHNEIYVNATTTSGFEDIQYMAFNGAPLNARYLMIDMPYTYAWYGSIWDDANPTNRYMYQCNPAFTKGYPILAMPPDLRYPGNGYYDSGGRGTGWTNKTGLMAGKEFSSTAIDARADCRASIIEVGIYKEIFKRKKITNHLLRQIQHDNRQISYRHFPDASETTTYTKNKINYRKYEPGTFFKWVRLNYRTHPTGYYNRFFKTDCARCYGEFTFGMLDQNNSMIKYRNKTSLNETHTNEAVSLPSFTKHILMRPGYSDTVVTEVDAWHGRLDRLSFGGSYAYTHKAGDWAKVHFRGISFVWWATVPALSNPGQVKIEIRSKPDGSSNYSDWSVIVPSLTLPVNIAAQKVWEIPLNSGILQENTVYELKITTLNSGFVSIDGFGGYWESEYTEINEDNEKIRMSDASAFKQLYSEKFSSGSCYKLNKTGVSLAYPFRGDRALIKMCKGPNTGRLKIWLTKMYQPYDGLDTVVNIPGGNADGSLTLDMETGTSRGHSIPQAIVFDTDSYFTNGLQWGSYAINVTLEKIEKVTVPVSEATDEDFVNTCDKCRVKPSTRTVKIVKPLYIDGFGIHEESGVSLKFVNETHFKQLQTVCESLRLDWEITDEDEINIVPRIGTDTNIIIKEGLDVVVRKQLVRDASQVATHLLSYGGDINGEPIYNVLEDKKNSMIFGRTVTRVYDYRSIVDINTLAGAQRIELEKYRRRPQAKINITLLNTDYGLNNGDTFKLKTRTYEERVQVISKITAETSSEGRYYELECVKWEPMI